MYTAMELYWAIRKLLGWFSRVCAYWVGGSHGSGLGVCKCLGYIVSSSWTRITSAWPRGLWLLLANASLQETTRTRREEKLH